MQHKSIAKCKECYQPIIWGVTSKGKNIPIDLDSVDRDELYNLSEYDKLKFVYRVHACHFETCSQKDLTKSG